MTGPRLARRRQAVRRTASSPVPPWPLSRIIGGAVIVMTAFLVAAVVTGGLALAHLSNERQRI